MPHRVYGNMSLAPTRVALFVSASQPAQLMKAMEINTCLWGGLYNPILPLAPELGTRLFRHETQPAPEDIVDCFIRSFEPESLVVPDPANFPNTRLVRDRQVLALDELHAQLGENRPTTGLSMLNVYQFLWQDTFRFEHREKTRFVSPAPAGDWPLFTAAVWGAFPAKTDRADFASWYEQLASPEATRLTSETFVKSCDEEWRDPLGLTMSHVHSRGRNRAYVILVRPDQLWDVMAFWTLRALGHYVVPVPLQWRDALLPLVRRLVQLNTVPHQEYVTICRGPRTPFRVVKEYAKAASTANAVAVASHLYPRVWSPDFLRLDDNGSWLESDTASVDSACEESRMVRLRTLTPKFIQRVGWAGGGQWTNCFEPWGSSERTGQELVLPPDLVRPRVLFDSVSRPGILISRRGIQIATRHADSTTWLRWPTGSMVLHHWLTEHGLEVRTSSAGHLANSLVSAMGGPRGMYWLGYPELIEAMNHTASLPGRNVKAKQAIDSEIRDAMSKHRGVPSRTIDEVFTWLLDHGALRLGLATQCTECQQQNWYPLDRIRYRLRCDRCGKSFPFPEQNAKRAWWAYSLTGPFSVPDYVAGGYGSVAALHALTRMHSDRCTWGFGVELRNKTNPVEGWKEIDVLVLAKEHEVVIPFLVEAKSGMRESGSRISEEEIARTEYLLDRFPTAVAVFSTMALTFETSTAERIKALVERLPNRSIGRHDSAKPILLLGRHELFGFLSLQDSWEGAGGAHAEIAKQWRHIHTVVAACHATQSLHLDALQAAREKAN